MFFTLTVPGESPDRCPPDAVLTAACRFEDVPVNTCTVRVLAEGEYCAQAESVLTVSDPSLGFTTGGCWFYWPETGDRVNVGYTMKYNRSLTNVKGNLLMIRHLPDGTVFRLKSNAILGLALGEEQGVEPFGWASFNGKATYQEPGWPEPEGNYAFVAYVEDHGEPGGSDRLWLEVYDKNGNVVLNSSMGEPATANAAAIEGGNIVVPHTAH
jgi:hypothetical protein